MKKRSDDRRAVFSGVRGKVLAKGNYELNVKLCNPKCS